MAKCVVLSPDGTTAYPRDALPRVLPEGPGEVISAYSTDSRGRGPGQRPCAGDVSGPCLAGTILRSGTCGDSSVVWRGTVEPPARFEHMRVGADVVFGDQRHFNEVESLQVLMDRFALPEFAVGV